MVALKLKVRQRLFGSCECCWNHTAICMSPWHTAREWSKCWIKSENVVFRNCITFTTNNNKKETAVWLTYLDVCLSRSPVVKCVKLMYLVLELWTTGNTAENLACFPWMMNMWHKRSGVSVWLFLSSIFLLKCHDLCAEMFSVSLSLSQETHLAPLVSTVTSCWDFMYSVTKSRLSHLYVPKHTESVEFANTMVISWSSTYYQSATLVSASIISLLRTICLDKYWFCVGPCNGTLCRRRSL